MNVKIEVEADDGMPEEAAVAFGIAGIIIGLVQSLKADCPGMTVDEAVGRISNAVRTAWEMPP